MLLPLPSRVPFPPSHVSAVALSVALRAVVPRMRMVSVTVQFSASPAMMLVFHRLPPSVPFTVDFADGRTVNVFAFPFSVSALESPQLCAPCAVPIQMFPSSFCHVHSSLLLLLFPKLKLRTTTVMIIPATTTRAIKGR